MRDLIAEHRSHHPKQWCCPCRGCRLAAALEEVLDYLDRLHPVVKKICDWLMPINVTAWNRRYGPEPVDRKTMALDLYRVLRSKDGHGAGVHRADADEEVKRDVS